MKGKKRVELGNRERERKIMHTVVKREDLRWKVKARKT